MKHISILVPLGQNNLSSIIGAYKILKRANSYAAEHGKKTYKLELVGVCGEVDFHEGLFFVKPEALISEVQHTDLMIIPSLNHNYEQAIDGNENLIKWIVKHYNNGAEVASICTGA